MIKANESSHGETLRDGRWRRKSEGGNRGKEKREEKFKQQCPS